MTEANPGDRELHLEYTDPFHSPTERMGSEDSMRRGCSWSTSAARCAARSIAASFT